MAAMGVRYELARKTHSAPFRYEGTVATETGTTVIAAQIDAEGSVTVDLSEPRDARIEERVRLFLRSVWKESEGQPPTFVRRWRENR
jgi:hypothetical protein